MRINIDITEEQLEVLYRASIISEKSIQDFVETALEEAVWNLEDDMGETEEDSQEPPWPLT